MSDLRSKLTPEQIAVADENRRHVISLVNAMLFTAPTPTDDHVADMLTIGQLVVIPGVVAIAEHHEDEVLALVAVASELIRRVLLTGQAAT